MEAASAVQATETIGSTYDGILKGYLIRALEASNNVVDKAVDTVMEQTPLLVDEVLRWYFTYNLITFLFAIVLLPLAFVVTGKILESEWWKKSDTFYGDPTPMFTVIVMNLLVFVIFLTQFNLQWLKIWVAPRLWLIEYTATLVKSMGK